MYFRIYILQRIVKNHQKQLMITYTSAEGEFKHHFYNATIIRHAL